MSNEELYELVKRYEKGDNSAFTVLYDETKKQIFANIYSFVKNETAAEDLLSDTYVQFIKYIPKIEKSQSILGFLYTTSRNLSLNYIKKENRNSKLEDNDFNNLSPTVETNNALDSSEIIKEMREILKEGEFNVIVLRIVNDMDYNEIAKLLKKNESTVRWLYSNGIKKIREKLNHE